MGMLNGLDLFSGIGGLTLALSDWVKPVAYCENDRYAQAVLMSRMWSGELPAAPIWDDITTLLPSMLPRPIDIIYGGFPCQDISCAGRGAGLGGKRSGLFFEIVRLVDEIRPTFIFLENVPAITTRGLGAVAAEITKRGYDCRWTIVSAAEVGANHLRKRWWLLGHSNNERKPALPINVKVAELSSTPAHAIGDAVREQSGGWIIGKDGEGPTKLGDDGENKLMADTNAGRELQPKRLKQDKRRWTSDGGKNLSDSTSKGLSNGPEIEVGQSEQVAQSQRSSWWSTEPNVGRVANGIPFRVDRLRGLGNAVVPLQAREAFMRLSGLKLLQEKMDNENKKEF